MNMPDVESTSLLPTPGSGDATRRHRGRPLAQVLAATLLFMAPLLLLPLARAAQSDAWQPLGLRGETVLGLAVTSSGGERLIYAETATGLWRLRAGPDGAQAWERIDAGLPRTALGGPALAAWRTVPGRPLQIYALTGAGTARQIYRSDDGGSTWGSIGPAPGQTARPALVILPGPGAADLITLATSTRAQRSSDGGATWAPGGPWPGIDDNAEIRNTSATEPLEPLMSLLGDPSAPERLYALAEDGYLWVSESGGLSWRVMPAGSLAPPVNALAIAPYFGIRIWAATAAGLAFSTDSGDTWTLLSLPTADGGPSKAGGHIVALRGDPRVPEIIYAALVGGAVYRSETSGASWVSLGAPGALRVTALALDPDSRAILYAATDDGIWTRAVVPSQPTPAPTPTETIPLPTETPTRTPTGTAPPTPSPTLTATPTVTVTPSPSSTASPTATATRRPTRTPTRTVPPKATATATTAISLPPATEPPARAPRPAPTVPPSPAPPADTPVPPPPGTPDPRNP